MDKNTTKKVGKKHDYKKWQKGSKNAPKKTHQKKHDKITQRQKIRVREGSENKSQKMLQKQAR